MKLPRTLLIDLDDTVVRYGAGGEGLWAEVLGRFARALPVAPERLLAAVDAVREPFWADPERSRAARQDMFAARRAILAQAFDRIGLSQESELVREVADAYSGEREARVVPFPGALEALAELRRRGHRLGLLTNGGAMLQVGGPVNFAMLESRQAVRSFIDCKACSGACITDINIYDPVTALPSAFAPSGTIEAINFVTTAPSPGYDPDKINGDILVRRCTIDCSNSAEGAGSDGISFADHVAKLAVLDCRIINCSFHGIVNIPPFSEQTVSRGGAYDVHGCEISTTRIFFVGGTGFGFTVGITGGGIAGPLSNPRLSDTSSKYVQTE